MKANEAPKKIYLTQTENGTHYYTEGVPSERNYIEYTRTDAFIEKACEWFRRIDYDDTIPPYETTGEFIEGFKKAMTI